MDHSHVDLAFIDGAIIRLSCRIHHFDLQVRFLAGDASWSRVCCTPDILAHVPWYARHLTPWDSWSRQRVWG